MFHLFMFKNFYFYFNFIKILISLLLILILILTLLKKNFISIVCFIAFNIILLLLFLTYLFHSFLVKTYWFVGSFLVTYYIEQALYTYCVMLNSIILELFKRSSRPNLQFISIFLLFTMNFSFCDGYDLPNNNGETIFLIIFFFGVGCCLAYVYSNSVKNVLDEYEEFNNNNNLMLYGPEPKPEHTVLNSVKEYDLFIFLDNWGYILFIIIFMVVVILLSYIFSKVYIKINTQFYNLICFSLWFTVIFFFIKLIYLNIVSILFGIVLIISLYSLTNTYFKKDKW